MGFSILELSKVLIYDFHYNYVKTTYCSKASLCFTVTNSLCYAIATDDVYLDTQRNQHHFDLSDYPETLFLHSDQNKKVLGKMKEECHGHVMREFVGLKPKMYSFTYERKFMRDDREIHVREEKKGAKGVSRVVVQSNIHHENYKSCLLHRESRMDPGVTFRSFYHQLFTLVLNKQV